MPDKPMQETYAELDDNLCVSFPVDKNGDRLEDSVGYVLPSYMAYVEFFWWTGVELVMNKPRRIKITVEAA